MLSRKKKYQKMAITTFQKDTCNDIALVHAQWEDPFQFTKNNRIFLTICGSTYVCNTFDHKALKF